MKKYIRSVLFIVLTIITLTSCTSEASMKAGKWKDDTFINEWSNIKFDLQQGGIKLGENDIKRMINAGSDVLINDSKITEKDLKDSESKTLYDTWFYLYDMMSNVSIVYENMQLSGRSYSEKDYVEQLKINFTSMTSLKYEDMGESEETIAGQKYLVSKFSVNDGAMYQKIYLRKIGNVMMLITASYLSDKESIVNDFIGSIKKP